MSFVCSSIDLSSAQLSGSIPDLSALANLTSLALERNSLTGTLPSSLGELQNLQSLSLGSNVLLSGTIPDGLATCTNLEYVVDDAQVSLDIIVWHAGMTSSIVLDLCILAVGR